MRMFTCLSKNVSMALDMTQQRLSANNDRRPKNRLNFRNKKRRAASTSAPNPSSSTDDIQGTPSKKHASRRVGGCTKNVIVQDENAPPTSRINHAPSVNSNFTANSCDSITTRRIPTRPTIPLPAIPTTDSDISIYIKELDTSDEDLENDSDYLPLAHIEPPLTEEETTSSSSPSPFHQRRPQHQYRRHYVSIASSATSSGVSTDASASASSPSPTSSPSQNIYSQISEVDVTGSINTTSTTAAVSKVKSVGSFNEAFIQSTASLPRLRSALSSTRHLDTIPDDCTNCASKHVQPQQQASRRTATASTSTSDIKPLMTYSRRKAAYVLKHQKKQQEQQQQKRDSNSSSKSKVEKEDAECRFYSADEAMLPRCEYSRSSMESLASRVDEVSDLLEASVAEYDSYKQESGSGSNANTKTRRSDISGSSSGVSSTRSNTRRRTDSIVEVCDISDDKDKGNDTDTKHDIRYDHSVHSAYASGRSPRQTQTLAACDLTQRSQDLSQCSQDEQVSIPTGVYSRLVDYTVSATTLPGEPDGQSQFEDTQADDELTQDESSSRFYENQSRPLRLCEGESQTSLTQTPLTHHNQRRYPHRHHQRRGDGACSSIDVTTGDNSDYSQVNNDTNYNSQASQSSLPSCLGETETELTADYYDDTVSDVTADIPDYVNVSGEERSRTDPNPSDKVNNDNDKPRSDSRASEFLGCMSFGVPHLLKKDLDGWYYLLTEEVGRKKHLQARGAAHTATTTRKPVLTSRGPPNVPIPNLSVEGQENTVITVLRGKNGFGFSFVDELPPKIGRVDKASPAEQAGIKKGDSVISINGKNVSRSTSKGVAHLVKQMKAKSLTLELQRDHVITGPCTTSTSTSTGTTVKRSVGTSSSSTSHHNHTDHLYESIMGSSHVMASAGVRDHHKENRRAMAEEEFATDDDDYSQTYDSNDYYNDSRPYHAGSLPNLKALTSTPMPKANVIQRQSSTQLVNRDRQESVHRLMSIELDFIDFMHYGIERYSRPLRHCIISTQQHGTIFQNVEKLVTISEFHIKQLQENAPSSVNSEDTDDSQSSESSSMFPNSVALIYQSKIHMLCQAYESYTHGLTHSNQLLRQLRSNQDFVNFIKDPSSSTSARGGSMFGHPSISAFINRPVQHINDLYTVFSEIFAATSPQSQDYPVLQKISTKLAQCITAITDLSSRGRVHSLDSLTSSQGCSTSQTSSEKGSMASLTSCSSAEAEALRAMRPPPPPSTASSVTSTSSLISQRPVDLEVARVQERLVFPPHIPTFQLCQDDRHIIFQGDIYRMEQGSWFKSHLLLLSDLLLLLDREVNGNLRVVDAPFYLSDLSGLEVNRKHASEFVLHLHTTTPFSTNPHPKKHHHHHPHQPTTRPVILRASSGQEKFMWKSLLEQRVSSVSGSKLRHYGSMRDISNVKTSVVL